MSLFLTLQNYNSVQPFAIKYKHNINKFITYIDNIYLIYNLLHVFIQTNNIDINILNPRQITARKTDNTLRCVGMHGSCVLVPEQPRNPACGDLRSRTHEPCVPTGIQHEQQNDIKEPETHGGFRLILQNSLSVLLITVMSYKLGIAHVACLDKRFVEREGIA